MNFDTLNSSTLNGSSSTSESFDISASIRIQVMDRLIISSKIGLSVYEVLPNFLTASTRRAVVTLNGVDVSSRLVGSVVVEAEEGLSRVATFTITPESGTIDLTSWIGVRVSIDHDVLVGGVSVLRTRMFTGIVDVPRADLLTGRVTFACTDDLQKVLDSRTRAQIDLLIPDVPYSNPISGADLKGYEYAKAREKGYIGSVDLTPLGVPRLTSWDAKSSADREYTASQVIYLSELVELANVKQITNQIELSFTYTFSRLKERVEQGQWVHPDTLDFCDFLAQPTHLPNRDMVLQALQGTGWVVASVSFTPPPVTQVFACSPDIGWEIRDDLRSQLITAAAWTLKKRYVQRISEQYDIVIKTPQSTDGLGPRPVALTTGFTAEYDASDWVSDLSPDSPLIGLNRLGGVGDYYEDRDDVEGFSREEAEEGMEWLIAGAMRDIRLAHRLNIVSFDIPLDPTVDLDLTIRLNTARIQAKGKVFRVVHTMSLEEGQAEGGATKTEIQLAISRSYTPSGSSYAVETDPVTTPAQPDTTDPDNIPAFSTVDRSIHVGGYTSAPAFDETWEGFTCNRTAFGFPEVGAPVYPVSFRVDSPEIDSTEVQQLNPVTEREYQVNIPNDELTLVAP